MAINTDERRVISSAWRVLTNEGEAQYRALDRLRYLAGEIAAFDVWLSTKPDPQLVEQMLTYHIMRYTPFRNAMPRKSYGEVKLWR